MRALRIAYVSLVPVFALGPLASGCALLVSPDDSRLLPPDGAARADGSVGTDGGPGTDGQVPQDVPVTPTDGPQMTCATSCDDSVACTVDRCDTSTGQCQHTPDNTRCMGMGTCDATMGCVVRMCANDGECSDNNMCNGVERCTGGHCAAGMALRCDDGQFCNGTESCNPTTGCVPGTAPSCDDSSPCTTDRCSGDAPGGGACVHTPVDMDGDRYPAAMVGGVTCAGGTDCNDSSGAVHPGVAEVCNGVDDDCNGMIDDGRSCPPPNDTCATATAVTITTGEMNIMGTTVGAMDGVATATCGGNGGADVWYSVTYPAANDLRVEVTPIGTSAMADPVLVMRDGCTSADAICNDDATTSARGSRIWVRPAPAATGMRTWIFIVDAYQSGAESPFNLHIATSTAVAGSVCGGALFDVTAGGSLYGVIPPGVGHTTGSCTPGTTPSRPEDVVVYNGPAGMVRLNAAARPTTAFQPSLYVRRTDCSSTTAEQACDNGSPASLGFNATAGSGNFIFVDNGTATGARYALGVLVP